MRSKVPSEQVMRRQRGGPLRSIDIDWNQPSDDEIVQFVNSQFRNGFNRRRRWEDQAALQLAWARGNQTQLLSDLRDSLEHVGEPLEVRWPATLNVLRRFITAWIGMLVARPFEFNVEPQTREDSDIAGARIQTKLLDHYFAAGQTSGMTRMMDAFWMLFATGAVWLKPLWDPHLGACDRLTPEMIDEARRMAAKETAAASGDGSAGGGWRALWGLLKSKGGIDGVALEPDGSYALPRGDLEIDFASGFELTEPYGAHRVQDCDWIIDSRPRSLEYVAERYGEEMLRRLGSDTDSETLQYRQREISWEYNDYSSDDGGDASHELVMVHELWRRRSRRYPKGFRAVVAGQVVLKRGPHPYLHGRLPFIRISEQPDPEHFRPGSSLRDLMGLQSSRNKIRSMAQGHFEMTCDPKYLVENGTELPKDAFDKGPKAIEVKAGSNSANGVKPLPQHPFPALGLQLDEMTKLDMEDVSGVHRSTMGRQESSSQSGIHAQVLREGDARQATTTRVILEEGLAAAGQQALAILSQYMTPGREIAIVGENGEPEILAWPSAAKHRGFQWHQSRVKCRLSAEISAGDTIERATSLVEMGILNPQNPADKAILLRMHGEQYSGPDIDDQTRHRANASLEHMALIRGEAIEVSGGDDDLVHIDRHQRWRVSAEFREALKQQPGLDAVIEGHIREHMYSQLDKQLRPLAMAERIKMELAMEYQLTPPGMAGGADAPAGNPRVDAPAAGAAGAAPPPGGPALRMVGGAEG